MNKVRGYIFSRVFMGERVPQHIQNLVIRDYCKRNHLDYLLSGTEYAMKNCHLILEQILGELNELNGLVLYSLYQLPESSEYRHKIYKMIVDQKKTLHFAVEDISASSEVDFEKVEMFWNIRVTLPHCAKDST